MGLVVGWVKSESGEWPGGGPRQEQGQVESGQCLSVRQRPTQPKPTLPSVPLTLWSLAPIEALACPSVPEVAGLAHLTAGIKVSLPTSKKTC